MYFLQEETQYNPVLTACWKIQISVSIH